MRRLTSYSMKLMGCYPSFVRAIGNELYLEDNEYVIKGMNFGNYMWYNPTTPVLWYNDENSYKELSEAGFNAIRWYINYALLEDDNNPYVYKETGLQWIDQNIEWAEKYNIKILLNMHIPQGAKSTDSYDEHVGSLNLFFGPDAVDNRSRLKEMWKFLANRYKDNTTILGYGLLNEPKLPFINSLEETKAIWENYAQELTDAIRTVDNNHIIFVEPTTSIVDTNTNENIIFSYEDSLFLINDDNYAVEYHFYHPMELTHQATNTNYLIGALTYPDNNLVGVEGVTWVNNTYYENGYDFSAGDFQKVESPLYKVDDISTMNVGCVALRVDDLGVDNYAYFDSIVVSEYDENGSYINNIMMYDCNKADDYKVYSSIYDGNVYYSDTEGRDGSGCIVVKDVTGTFTVTNSNTFKFFALTEGHQYKIAARVKIVGSTSTKITPILSFYKADKVSKLDKQYMADKIAKYIEFSNANNIPLYMGEYGTFVASLEHGGVQWISDMLDIINENQLSASYHEYKPGLYLDYSKDTVEATRSDELYNLFASKYN